MARLGSFSRLLVPAQWFGEVASVEGWFGADELIQSSSAPSGAISATCSASTSQSVSLTGNGALAATVSATASQTASIGGGLGSIRGNASGDNITYSTTAPSGSSHSVIFFARARADRNTYSCPMSIDAGSGDYVYAETEVDGLVMKMWDDSGGSVTGPTMSVDTWYVFAWTKSGTTINFYWATAGSTTLSNASFTGTTLSPSTVRFLESPWTGEWFDGAVFGARIWDGAVLSQSELETEMVQARAARTSNLWFEGLFSGASDLTDYSGGGRNFTGGGSLATEDPPAGIPLYASSGGSISASISATTSQTGALTGTGALSASVASTSGQAASLVGKGALAATVAVSSGQTGTLSGVALITATLASVASQSASLIASGALAASVPATSSQTASMVASGALASAIAATSGQTGTLSGTGPIAATIAAQSGQSGTLAGQGALAANLPVTASQTATLAASGALLASLSASAGSTAGLTGTGALNATVGAVAALTGSMPGTAGISATVAASASQSGILSATGSMSASVGSTAGGTYSLLGSGALSASIPAQSGHAADLSSLSSGNMSATASGSTSANGTLFALGALSATLPANTNTVADLGLFVSEGSPGIVDAAEFMAGIVSIWTGASSETEAMERTSSYCNMVEFINGIAAMSEFEPISECKEYVEGVAS